MRSLRDRALDESEPLAGLLRKCLLPGAETGSTSLRHRPWLELNGHTYEATIPDYRKLPGVLITVNSISGTT
ncbi:hypothetical protein [uncultured Microbacterium sp.]|uniref:AbiTii domain-containing protein n=1 Tax=uncultured Microbacterium sp. TaxID=191216 RepID=UPI003459E259